MHFQAINAESSRGRRVRRDYSTVNHPSYTSAHPLREFSFQRCSVARAALINDLSNTRPSFRVHLRTLTHLRLRSLPPEPWPKNAPRYNYDPPVRIIYAISSSPFRKHPRGELTPVARCDSLVPPTDADLFIDDRGYHRLLFDTGIIVYRGYILERWRIAVERP